MAPGRAYLDVPTFQASYPGLFLSPILGGNALLAAASLVGATTLSVNVGAGFQNGQVIYLLDGPNSETALLAASGGVSGTTLTLAAPLAYAHVAGVSVSSGGASGALGQKILEASGWLENYCDQGTLTDRSLFSKTRSEKLKMPTMRAALDPSFGLKVAPLSFPVTAVSAVAIEYAPGVSMGLNAGQVEIDAEQKGFTVPALVFLTATGVPWNGSYYLRRAAAAWASYTYTAGFEAASLPWDLVHAATLVVRDKVAQAENPTGAAMIRQESVEVMQRLRGGSNENSADSIFMVEAKEILETYRNKLL